MESPSENINIIHKQRLGALEKLALLVTNKIGTMGFFFIIFGWTVLWLGWNIFAPDEMKFDPFPAFVLWLFISNLIQLHLLPLIMVGQNIQGKHAELRAEYDFQTDKKAEMEIEKISAQLSELLKKIEELEKKKS